LRVSIGAAAPTPLLIEGFSDDDRAEDVVTAALEAIRPISDLRASKEYRQFMVEVYVRRLLEEVR
jgi:carbon-monoxide dehydrogenase medium subunit